MSAARARPVSFIRLEGTFDLPAARFLENALKRNGGAPVCVDFARVRDFRDFAVAVLAHALKAHGGPAAKVEGLGMHQMRLLRYFGVDADVFRRDDDAATSR